MKKILLLLLFLPALSFAGHYPEQNRPKRKTALCGMGCTLSSHDSSLRWQRKDSLIPVQVPIPKRNGEDQRGKMGIGVREGQGKMLSIKDATDGTAIGGAEISIGSTEKPDHTTVLWCDTAGLAGAAWMKEGVTYSARIRAKGYRTKETEIAWAGDVRIQTVELERAYKEMKEVVITGYRTIGCKHVVRCLTSCKVRVQTDGNGSVQKRVFVFQAYPNPVENGGSLRIDLQQRVQGKLCLLNTSGQTVASRMILHSGEGPLVYPLPHLAAGSYFLRLADGETGKIFTEKIIVQ